MKWRGHTIATAPLTAGGLTVLQAIAALKALEWHTLPAGPTKSQAWLEALRIAWGDRLMLLGDPEHADVPIEHLLSEKYAQQSADKIRAAIAERRPVPVATDGATADGTLHVSAVDASGMMASATLTHGNSFGAQVVVDGLGLILGHGMSRFDPVPGRPNSIAPFKRPLHNMCPTIVFHDNRPVLALGATGGRRIPNAVFQTLLSYIGNGSSLEEAVTMPRLHTEGGMDIYAERHTPDADVIHLAQIGYRIQPPLRSLLFAVEQYPENETETDSIGVGDHVAKNSTSGIRVPRPKVTRRRRR
jgi:gamma-glutamyltranspeptidase/glutathione hydrolase